MSDHKLDRLQPVQQPAATLAGTVGNLGRGLPTDRALAPPQGAPTLAQKANALAAQMKDQPPTASCQQCLWISVFFDGTGNNMKSDVPTFEHSNVARMFRAMRLDSDVTGIYSRYIPGIGTLFPEKGDSGKGPIPFVDHHNGMGGMGQVRLDYAFEEIDKIVRRAEARAQNPTNKILMIKLAVFGFSRGATLARAFLRDLLDPKLGKVLIEGAELRWQKGEYPLSIEFAGIWDTVASVGLPMSANNVTAIRSERRWLGNLFKKDPDKPEAQKLRVTDIAFGAPGADPAPGPSDGHGAWADGLAIPPQVKACVHMIAGHEIRNSFPVDSVLRGRTKPSNCREIVYPGAHSDVGGGYRPGEQGKGTAAASGADSIDADKMLSQVTLRAMYDEARQAGVPLRAMGGADWKQDNIDDFPIAARLIELFNHYMATVGSGGRPLGAELLAHTRMFLAWRWYRIAHGRAAELGQLKKNDAVYAADGAALERRLQALQRERDQHRQAYESAALQRSAILQRQGGLAGLQIDVAQRQQLAELEQTMAAQDAAMKPLDQQIAEIKDRQRTLPGMGKLEAALARYDAELVDDVRAVLKAIEADPSKRLRLRPHYKNLVETYEDQFKHGRGLTDERIIAFFDNHVHDSLAGFDQDSTLPSDPRVVYVGGDQKLNYANRDVPQPQAIAA